jgi:hypothetical protein
VYLILNLIFRWWINRIDRWDQKRLLAGKPVKGFVIKDGPRGYMSELERLSLSGGRPSTAGRG